MLKDTFYSFPRLLKAVFAVQFLTSMGKNGALMFVTDWFGEQVYGGMPVAKAGSDEFERFERGVRMGSLAMLCCGAISGAFGLALPCLLRLASKRTVWAVALASGAVTMLLMALLDQWVPCAFALTACIGVALGARESIPWSIVTAASKGSGSAGANTAVFNLSQALPALMGVFMGSLLLRVGPLSSIFAACAVPLGLAVVAVFALVPADLEPAEREACGYGASLAANIGRPADHAAEAACACPKAEQAYPRPSARVD